MPVHFLGNFIGGLLLKHEGNGTLCGSVQNASVPHLVNLSAQLKVCFLVGGFFFLCANILLVILFVSPQPPFFCIRTDESAQPAPVHFITSTPEQQPLQDSADSGPIRPLMRRSRSPSGLLPAAEIQEQKKN